MCGKIIRCQKPKNLKKKGTECSTDQIKKCHGSSKVHPCARETIKTKRR